MVNLKIIFVEKQKQTRERPTQGRGDIHYNRNGRFHTRDGWLFVWDGLFVWKFASDRKYLLIWNGKGFNFEWTIRLTLSVNFDEQFEDGLSLSDSLCTAAPPPQKKIREGVSVGEGATIHKPVSDE